MKIRGGSGRDHIHAFKIVVEEYLRKGNKLHAAFMDVIRVDRESLWNAIRIYRVGVSYWRELSQFM